MKVFGERDATDEKTPIEFSKLHRMSLLATPCLAGGVFVPMMMGQYSVLAWTFLTNGIYLSLVVGLISSFGLIHAALILFDAPERRIMRNVIPTLLAAASLLLFVVVLPGVGPQ